MKNKPTIIALVLASSLALAGATATFAATTTTATANQTPADPVHHIVQDIADTFHVDATDVQKVFDSERSQAEADRLAQAVTDGKLTQTQADIVTKDLADLQANNIPLEYLLPAHPGMHHPGMNR